MKYLFFLFGILSVAFSIASIYYLQADVDSQMRSIILFGFSTASLFMCIACFREYLRRRRMDRLNKFYRDQDIFGILMVILLSLPLGVIQSNAQVVTDPHGLRGVIADYHSTGHYTYVKVNYLDFDAWGVYASFDYTDPVTVVTLACEIPDCETGIQIRAIAHREFPSYSMKHYISRKQFYSHFNPCYESETVQTNKS